MEKIDEEGGFLRITDWHASDRPREKLVDKGRRALSDAELVAILIGSGTRKESAVAVAQKVLKLAANDLNDLAKLSLSDLQRINGIGQAKAISIVAALELGRRRKETPKKKVSRVLQSSDAFDELMPLMMDLPNEECWALLLNRGNKVVKTVQVAAGGFNQAAVDMKYLFSETLHHRAQGIILGHNHPSGRLKVSEADRQMTQKIKEAATILGLQLLDHLILCDHQYLSMADEGLL